MLFYQDRIKPALEPLERMCEEAGIDDFDIFSEDIDEILEEVFTSYDSALGVVDQLLDEGFVSFVKGILAAIWKAISSFFKKLWSIIGKLFGKNTGDTVPKSMEKVREKVDLNHEKRVEQIKKNTENAEVKLQEEIKKTQRIKELLSAWTIIIKGPYFLKGGEFYYRVREWIKNQEDETDELIEYAQEILSSVLAASDAGAMKVAEHSIKGMKLTAEGLSEFAARKFMNDVYGTRQEMKVNLTFFRSTMNIKEQNDIEITAGKLIQDAIDHRRNRFREFTKGAENWAATHDGGITNDKNLEKRRIVATRMISGSVLNIFTKDLSKSLSLLVQISGAYKTLGTWYRSGLIEIGIDGNFPDTSKHKMHPTFSVIGYEPRVT